MATKVRTVFSEERNPRGIPKAPFIADVEEYLGGPDAEVEGTLKGFQDALASANTDIWTVISLSGEPV